MWCSPKINSWTIALLAVNDIHRCSNKFWFYLFADNSNILYADKNLKDLETIVNNELQNLYNTVTVPIL